MSLVLAFVHTSDTTEYRATECDRPVLTFTKIVAYLGGILLLAMGVAATLDGPEGLLVVAAGLFALPAVRDPLTDHLDVRLPKWAVLGIVIVLLAVGMQLGGRSVMP